LNSRNIILGETVGTATLVLLGCGTNACALLFGPWPMWAISLGWTVAVFAAIMVSRKPSHAHLNPIVSIGLLSLKKTKGREAVIYCVAQAFGALLGALLLYALLHVFIEEYESTNTIIRSYDLSRTTAGAFADFPNPKYASQMWVNLIGEGLGGFALFGGILLITKKWHINDSLIAPLLIACTVGILIYFIAPYSPLGMNPARDFMPRLVLLFGGWGRASFPASMHLTVTAYIMAPILGALFAAFLWARFEKGK